MDCRRYILVVCFLLFVYTSGQEPKKCETLLPDGRVYEHSCDQEIIPVQCQYEVNAEAEEQCYDGYSPLQVFLIAFFSAGGAICIDLIIRCCKEATDETPASYADAHGNKKWTTSVSELRERRKAIRLRSLQDEFEQQTKAQTSLHRGNTQEYNGPSIVVQEFPMTAFPGEAPTPNEFFDSTSNCTYEHESVSIDNDKQSESDATSDLSLAYNESKV